MSPLVTCEQVPFEVQSNFYFGCILVCFLLRDEMTLITFISYLCVSKIYFIPYKQLPIT